MCGRAGDQWTAAASASRISSQSDGGGSLRPDSDLRHPDRLRRFLEIQSEQLSPLADLSDLTAD